MPLTKAPSVEKSPPFAKEVTKAPSIEKSLILKEPPVKASSIEKAPILKDQVPKPPSVEKSPPLAKEYPVTKMPSIEKTPVPKIPSVEKEPKYEKLPSPPQPNKLRENNVDLTKTKADEDKVGKTDKSNEESNGVGDKIKKFEKAAEDASANAGRMSRPGSVRGRSRTERLGSDSKDDLPPPATPFKDNHFELTAAPPEKSANTVNIQNNIVAERQQSISRNAVKWQRVDSDSERPKPEPQRIIKPEFKPIASPSDVPIRSPSLGAKIPDQFPSHGTAFRNVSEDFKCKFKPKEKYSVSKGSSYFTRGSEEIWLVKKKDIEEIEERVLDSFRRAGGNVCMRSDSMRPASDGGSGAATMGRRGRQGYARSESLDPGFSSARAQTLKRQTSVACTCGHDKKPPGTTAAGARAKSAETARPRLRSHGDDASQQHVLDKYETLV